MKLTYRLLRDILWLPMNWRQAGGFSTDQVVEALLALLFDGITSPAARRRRGRG